MKIFSNLKKRILNPSSFSNFELKITLIKSTLLRCVFSAANELPRCCRQTVINYIKYQQIFLDSPQQEMVLFHYFLLAVKHFYFFPFFSLSLSLMFELFIVCAKISHIKKKIMRNIFRAKYFFKRGINVIYSHINYN